MEFANRWHPEIMIGFSGKMRYDREKIQEVRI